MDRTESDSPRRELSNGGLESVVTLLVRRQIEQLISMVEVGPHDLESKTSAKSRTVHTVYVSTALRTDSE